VTPSMESCSSSFCAFLSNTFSKSIFSKGLEFSAACSFANVE
jgi:hypothetical protein